MVGYARDGDLAKHTSPREDWKLHFYEKVEDIGHPEKGLVRWVQKIEP